MGNGIKLKNQWEFKKRENVFGSCSNESKSSASWEPTRKKHKLVSSLISLKKDEAINKCTESQPKWEKEKRDHTERSKKDSLTNNDLKRDSNRNLSGEKSAETTSDELVALDDFEFLMESLLEDLKVTRENLFTWMKEEMKKLVADDTQPQLERKECSYKGEKVQVHHQEFFEEKIDVRNQNNFEENIQVCHERSVKETIVFQHQNSLKGNFHMQHHNKFPVTKLQHQNNFKENIQAPDQNDFKPDLRDQNSNAESLERSPESNEESGFDNCYETLEDLDDYAESSRHTISTEKDRKESLALHVKLNTQSCHASQSDQMQHQKKFPSSTTSENCNGGGLESYVEVKRLPDHNCHEAPEYQVDYDPEIESITSSPKKKGDDFGLSVESNITFHLSNQAASSMYLMLPTVLSGQPSFDNHRLESSCNYIQPTVTGNRIGKSLEGANHQGKFSALQQEERNRSFARLNPSNVGSFIQGSISNSIFGNGFPDSLHQGIDTGFSLPRTQLSFKNQTQEKTNMSGSKVDRGALSFSGGSYALSEHYVANKLGSHSNNKAESRLNSFPNLRSQ